MQRCCFGRISRFPFLTLPLTIRPQHVEQHRQREAAEQEVCRQEGSLKTASEFRKPLDDNGLKCPSAHLQFDLANLQKTFDDAI
jgi:hypothetical protein